MKQSTFEIIVLAQLVTIVLAAVCWGPPGPPSTPVSSVGTLAITAALIAGYGLWKSRK